MNESRKPFKDLLVIILDDLTGDPEHSPTFYCPAREDCPSFKLEPMGTKLCHHWHQDLCLLAVKRAIHVLEAAIRTKGTQECGETVTCALNDVKA